MRNTWIELPQICALRCCVGLLRWVLNRLPLERHRRSPQQEDQERTKSLQPKKPIRYSQWLRTLGGDEITLTYSLIVTLTRNLFPSKTTFYWKRNRLLTLKKNFSGSKSYTQSFNILGKTWKIHFSTLACRKRGGLVASRLRNGSEGLDSSLNWVLGEPLTAHRVSTYAL